MRLVAFSGPPSVHMALGSTYDDVSEFASPSKSL